MFYVINIVLPLRGLKGGYMGIINYKKGDT
jgi:hypothetical protein